MKRPLPSAFARGTVALVAAGACAPWRCRGRRGLGHAGARSGLAALEFALTAPILSALFIGSVDVAQLFMGQLKLSSAVFAGADYALVNASEASSASGAALAASIAAIVGNVNGAGWASGTVVVNNGPTATFSAGSSAATGTASNANLYYCLTGSPGAWTWGTGQTTSASCGTSGTASGKFVTISATTTVTPLITGMSFTTGTINQSVAVQVQ
jgi:Flp pilus assembly protein TadG